MSVVRHARDGERLVDRIMRTSTFACVRCGRTPRRDGRAPRRWRMGASRPPPRHRRDVCSIAWTADAAAAPYMANLTFSRRALPPFVACGGGLRRENRSRRLSDGRVDGVTVVSRRRHRRDRATSKSRTPSPHRKCHVLGLRLAQQIRQGALRHGRAAVVPGHLHAQPHGPSRVLLRVLARRVRGCRG